MLATVASFLASHAVAMLMLSAGLHTQSSILLDFHARRRVLARAVMVVWLAVPLLALVVVYLVRPAPLHATTLLVMAVCPGVPLVLRRSKQSRGDAKTTLLILIATALTAFVMIPLWMLVLNRVAGLALTMGLRDVATVLVPSIVLPFVIGRIVVVLSPRIAKPLAAIAEALFIAGLAVIVIAVISHAGASFRELGARELLAAVLVPLGAAALGYWAGRPAIGDRVSTTYAAALGNPALALAVMAHSQHSKVPALIAFLVMRGLALLPVKLMLRRARPAERVQQLV
jgi:BASS family bile acid:Na+ symporter